MEKKKISEMTCGEIKEICQELQYDLETYIRDKICEYDWLFESIKIKMFHNEIYIRHSDVFEIIPQINVDNLFYKKNGKD